MDAKVEQNARFVTVGLMENDRQIRLETILQFPAGVTFD
jgi:hypothetical protein